MATNFFLDVLRNILFNSIRADLDCFHSPRSCSVRTFSIWYFSIASIAEKVDQSQFIGNGNFNSYQARWPLAAYLPSKEQCESSLPLGHSCQLCHTISTDLICAAGKNLAD